MPNHDHDSRWAGFLVRTNSDLTSLHDRGIITEDEARRLFSVLDEIDTRRLMEAKREALGDVPLVDPSNLVISEITCTLGPDLCARCWDAALAAEAYARPTGATSGTYRDEQRNSEGVLVVHLGTWSREADDTGGVVTLGGFLDSNWDSTDDMSPEDAERARQCKARREAMERGEAG